MAQETISVSLGDDAENKAGASNFVLHPARPALSRKRRETVNPGVEPAVAKALSEGKNTILMDFTIPAIAEENTCGRHLAHGLMLARSSKACKADSSGPCASALDSIWVQGFERSCGLGLAVPVPGLTFDTGPGLAIPKGGRGSSLQQKTIATSGTAGAVCAERLSVDG